MPDTFNADDDTLGPCGCTDYHLADCPTRTGGTGMTAEDAYRMAYYPLTGVRTPSSL